MRARLVGEFVGTLLLLAVVVGSGVMGERLAAGNAAVALLANTLATGAGLYVLILVFGPVSGAHFNPLVSAMACIRRELSATGLAGYVIAQLLGAFAGVVLAHAMFNLPLVQTSSHPRSSAGERIGEIVATFGLLLVIDRVSRSRPAAVPLAVAAWISSAYWFTSSTSFANPAVTLARATTDSFAGIAPASVAGFMLAQLLGASIAGAFCHWLQRPADNDAAETCP